MWMIMRGGFVHLVAFKNVLFTDLFRVERAENCNRVQGEDAGPAA
jgi:hypothetical protein